MTKEMKTERGPFYVFMCNIMYRDLWVEKYETEKELRKAGIMCVEELFRCKSDEIDNEEDKAFLRDAMTMDLNDFVKGVVKRTNVDEDWYDERSRWGNVIEGGRPLGEVNGKIE